MFIGVPLISAALGFTPDRSVERVDAVALRVDSGATLARENLVMRDAGDAMVGTLTLTLTAKEVIAASTMLDLPRGSRILAMTLDHGSESFVARSLPLDEARRRFVQSVDPPPDITIPRAPRDPALLELERSGGSELVRLTVFPISASAPATVTVTFATPHFDRIDVFAGRELRESLLRTDLAAASDDDVVLAREQSRVLPERALYAAPDAPAPSEAELARRFDAVRPVLARCAAVDDPSAVQQVSLHLEIDDLGHTTLRSSEGAGINLVDCLRQVIDNVQFADDAATSLAIAFDIAPRSPPQ
jgi:hypothetical protein